MVEIAVLFYSEPNAKSRTRRVSFPRVAKSQLHQAIRETMRSSEFFACSWVRLAKHCSSLLLVDSSSLFWSCTCAVCSR